MNTVKLPVKPRCMCDAILDRLWGCRHAGRSRVRYMGIEGKALGYHIWKRGVRSHPNTHAAWGCPSPVRSPVTSPVGCLLLHRCAADRRAPWRADFFTSVINQKLPRILGATVLAYVLSFFFWASVWYSVWRRARLSCAPCTYTSTIVNLCGNAWGCQPGLKCAWRCTGSGQTASAAMKVSCRPSCSRSPRSRPSVRLTATTPELSKHLILANLECCCMR